MGEVAGAAGGEFVQAGGQAPASELDAVLSGLFLFVVVAVVVGLGWRFGGGAGGGR